MSMLVEGKDFYYNGRGLMVFTREYHLNRGFCCGNGCRHCPFGYTNVREPLRTELRKKADEKAGGESRPDPQT